MKEISLLIAIALLITLGLGTIGAETITTISDQLTAEFFDPASGKLVIVPVATLIEGRETGKPVPIEIPARTLTFTDIVGTTKITSDTVTIGKITGTITSDPSKGEPSPDPGESATLLSVAFSSALTDTLTAVVAAGGTLPDPNPLTLTEDKEASGILGGTMTIPNQTFTLGENGDDVVTLKSFNISFVSGARGEVEPPPDKDKGEGPEPIFSLKLVSAEVPEPGTLTLTLLGLGLICLTPVLLRARRALR